MANDKAQQTPATAPGAPIEKDPVHKCGYRKCDFFSETRDGLYQHLEEAHGIKRKHKPTDGQ